MPIGIGGRDGILPDMDVRTSEGAKVPHAEYFPPQPTPRGPSLWMTRLAEDWRELVRYWPVIHNMVVQELRVRYQRSILGFLWTLLNPLLMLATMCFVFAHLFKTAIPNYPLYLLAGMVPWSFLSAGLGDSAMCIIANEGLIRKIYLPKLVFPLARVLINLVTFVFSLSAMFLLLGPLGARPSLSMLFLPVVIGLFAAFTLGLGLLVATANTFYRDCGHLVSVFLQAWYFVTPIIYPMDGEIFPENWRWLFRLNPAFYFIELFHDVLCSGRWPRFGLLAVAAVLAAASLGVGYAIFKSHEDKMVFRL
jgi:ABC-2 type transport system permease protein/lipopolysaccharide transport system permease protein